MKGLVFNIQKCSLHDGFGIRTTVFFKGCNLSCKWCANPESQSCEPQVLNEKETGRYYTVEDLTHELVKDKPFYDMSDGGVTLSGGEPLLQSDFVAELCRELKRHDIHIAIETAAYIKKDIFNKVISHCNLALIDLKHWNSKKHKEGVNVGNELIISNIKHALQRKDTHVIVRIPVIPGFNDSTNDAEEFAKLLSDISVDEVHLLPFHQLGERKYSELNMDYSYIGVPQIHEEDIGDYADVMVKYHIKVQIGG